MQPSEYCVMSMVFNETAFKHECQQHVQLDLFFLRKSVNLVFSFLTHFSVKRHKQ